MVIVLPATHQLDSGSRQVVQSLSALLNCHNPGVEGNSFVASSAGQYNAAGSIAWSIARLSWCQLGIHAAQYFDNDGQFESRLQTVTEASYPIFIYHETNYVD